MTPGFGQAHSISLQEQKRNAAHDAQPVCGSSAREWREMKNGAAKKTRGGSLRTLLH